jgi:hypothetical protein
MVTSHSAWFELRRLAILVVVSLAIAGCAGVGTPPESHEGLQRGGWQNRFFRYDGSYHYYAGFDLQQLHADANIDYRAKLDFLASYGVNKVRIWLFAGWFGLPGDRNYPPSGKILYPWRVDDATNKFDIDHWDREFWDRTRDFLAYAKSKNFIVEVTLFSVQEPRNYFGDSHVSYPFHFEDNVQQFGHPTEANGDFMGGFYDLDYVDNNLRMADYQKAYIDKALEEFEPFDHIYYELINESPGVTFWTLQDLPHLWTKHWLRYIAENTDRIVTTHNSGFINLRDDKDPEQTSAELIDVGRRYWDEESLDGFNVHLYSTNPDAISVALSGYQLKGKMLICNEGGSYYAIDKGNPYPDFELAFNESELFGEIRHAWGMMTAGGYYSIYYGPVPLLGDRSSREGAKAMQALREIVETVDFQFMRPVRANGTEYDDLVTSGPASNWQVIANEGASYIVYFWGRKTATSVGISMPPGNYRYAWLDTREAGPPLKSGEIAVDSLNRANIESPAATGWNKAAGVVLVIQAAAE